MPESHCSVMARSTPYQRRCPQQSDTEVPGSWPEPPYHGVHLEASAQRMQTIPPRLVVRNLQSPRSGPHAFQLERGGQWDKGKSYDSFAPIGPWLLTADEVPDPHAIDLWLEVNGRRVQSGSTRNFIFGVPMVLAYISQFMTLEPGDIVLTGTPAGVGLGQKPAPWFLKPGDVVRLGATGLGEQAQTCVGG